MYPTKFPKNRWYVAAHSDEVGRDLLSRRILGELVCLYRREDGEVAALEDRCLHRHLPLSKGRLYEDFVECGYHGIVYDSTGQAQRIPSQNHVPPACKVRNFPQFERWGLVWLWMGDPQLADEALVPDHHWIRDPAWGVVRGTLHMKARAQLLNENLLDLSHLSFLHADTIGSAEVASTPVTVEHEASTVRVLRPMKDIESPPFFVKTMGLDGRIDRGQVAEFHAPAFHVTHVSATPTGGGEDAEVFEQKAIHCVTPETETTTHYFWCHARNYRIDDAEISDLMEHGFDRVFREDVDACEAIEEALQSVEPDKLIEVNIKVDAGPLRARRIIEEMIAAEAGDRA